MKFAIVCLGVWILGVSPALGQIILNSQQRSVDAHASLLWDDWENLQFNILDEDTDQATSLEIGPFIETVTAIVPHPWFEDPQVTAWQDSFISPNEIVAQGGVRDLATPGFVRADGDAWANSAVTVQFFLDTPTRAELHGDLFWSPTAWLTGNGYFVNGGSVSYSLVGPITVARMPFDDGDRSRYEPRQQSFADVLALEPGIYTLSILAEHASRIHDGTDMIVTPVSYDVRLALFPIPEPATWVLGLVVLAFGAYRARSRYSAQRR